ncbi:MAG: hypothetical protein IPP61_00035 [Cytophagaceae bacterium]|nr:hypothetical protein [Cytophagaceae bacterium]
MKKILFALLISNFCFGQQSITISPTDATHLKIFQKAGTAQLTIQGDGDLPTPPVFLGVQLAILKFNCKVLFLLNHGDGKL